MGTAFGNARHCWSCENSFVAFEQLRFLQTFQHGADQASFDHESIQHDEVWVENLSESVCFLVCLQSFSLWNRAARVQLEDKQVNIEAERPIKLVDTADFKVGIGGEIS